MKSHRIVCSFVPLVFLISLAQASDLHRFSIGGEVIHGGNSQFTKAGNDTINLMAAADDPTNNSNPGPCSLLEPIYRGDFELGVEGGRVETDGSGWTSIDFTQPTVTHWEVSDYDGFNTPFSSYRAWCGDATIASCDANDPEGGYGNNWNDVIEFTVAVGNPTVSTQVDVTAMLQHDSEPGYDYTYLSYRYQGQLFGDMASWDGESWNTGVPGPIAVTGSVTYLPQEYVGGTHIAVYWRFRSDGAWSDEDCLFPNAGGCMVDDVNIRVTNDGSSTDYFTDFNDGSFGLWNIVIPDGVGDFARIYRGLGENDPCGTNFTAQVAFIDNDVAVPGTGGSTCLNWCYGPGGYIVTTTGGLIGETDHIHNAIESPVMAWPVAKDCVSPVPDGIILTFSVYKHEDLTDDAPGIFYTWGVRSADTDGSSGDVQDITEQHWRDRNFVYYGGPEFFRHRDDVTDRMNPGRDEVQVQLAVGEWGYVWGWTGDDGYPAPYFDNVTVKVFPYQGPGMSAREIDLAQDSFPERETIDYGDLGSNSVRFDSANNISPAFHLRNDPGDSIIVDIVPVRAGAELESLPMLHYLLDPNPVFTSAMRTAGLPDMGSVQGRPGIGCSGDWILNKYSFDLPDTGFLFPGDVLHYYIFASDHVGGDVQSVTMPADTTGFSTSFGDPLGYNSTFTVHALPSIREDYFGDYEHPEILFINDFGGRGGENEWYTALSHIGLLPGEDYDLYHVNGPSSGEGNGIGGRAGGPMLTGYTHILYTCGNLGRYTISNGDYYVDPGNDVATLTHWLDQGGKDMFLTGDDLASDLDQSGQATQSFLLDMMGLSVVTRNVRPSIGNQTTPLVKPIPGNPVFPHFSGLQDWIAFGGCAQINSFDGVIPVGAGQRLAEFEDPQGMGYNFSAATLNILNPGPEQSRVISMPVDLMYVYTNPHAPGHPLPARVQLLREVLEFFDFGLMIVDPSGVDDLPNITFAASIYPNPFNPVTTIKYSLPRAGNLKLNIYNVRGQLVKTLIEALRPAGADQTVFWDGTDNLGSAAASGLYFYEVRAAGEIIRGKMTLLK